jgi:exo-1,4-beta-D-glucosaminidase
VHWDDNYVSLMPGEQRVITATYEDAANRPTAPGVKVDGWNVKPTTVKVSRTAAR